MVSIPTLAKVVSWRVSLEQSLRGRRVFRFKGGSFCVLVQASLSGLKALAYGFPSFSFMSFRLSLTTLSLIP